MNIQDINGRIWLSSPHMSAEGYEQEYIQEAFEENYITSAGKNVNGFEDDLKDYLDVSNLTALASGSAALHLSAILAGVHADDLVFCQSLTFAASVNPMAYQHAKIVLIDSEPYTWNMSPIALKKAIEQYGVPKAVVVVHLYGIPAKIDEIKAICDEYEIALIEDAAEALGAEYKGQLCGTFGDFGVLSFNGNKIITTSGGGALICKKAEDSTHAVKLSTQAREPFPWYEHTELGYNYRMSNICAGIGRGQMKVLQERIGKKRYIFRKYTELLNELPVEFMPAPDGTNPNYWLTVILLNPECSITPNYIIGKLNKADIDSRNFWKPMHLQPIYKDCAYVCEHEGISVSDDLFRRGICLPSDTKMSDKDIEKVCGVIREAIENA